MVAAVLCGAVSCAADDKPFIWPLPKSYTRGTATVVVNPVGFEFRAAGDGASADLQAAFARYTAQYFPRRTPSADGGISAVEVTVTNDTAALQLGVDESYTLTVSAGGAAIRAATQFGAYHAMETLGQLIVFNATAKQYAIGSAPWRIDDAPRFSHRELLIDTSRHYQTLASLKIMVQSLTYAKINVVHWHIVDWQAFPYIAPSAPQIAKGAYSPQETYTQDDIKDVVDFARQRGVRIVMEVDTPGHASSMCAGFPEVCPSAGSPLDRYTALRPDTNATFDLLEKLMRDLLSVAPDAYFHIGGDEVHYDSWNNSPEVVAWMKARGYTAHDAYLYFVQRVTGIVQSLGRRVVGWDELWTNFGTQLDKSTIIQQWRSWSDITYAATSHGYNLLWSMDSATGWYLDSLGATWDMVYVQEPCSGLDSEQCKLVLGGGGSMWGETVDPSDIQNTVWPRLGAIAERLWSQRDATASADDAAERMRYFRCYLNAQGVAAAPVNNDKAREAPPGPGSCYAQ